MSDLPARVDADYLEWLHVALDQINDPVGVYRAYHFVARQHDTAPQQWAQTLRQIQACYGNLQQFAIDRERLLLEIEEIEERRCWTRRARAHQRLDLGEKALALKNLDRGILAEERKWAAHEVSRQYIQREADRPDGWTREEIEADQEEYWTLRLTRQARHGVAERALGIPRGELDALRQSHMGEAGGVAEVFAQIDASNLALEDRDG